MILGVNDGLVSTFLLVAGVSGGGLSAVAILLTGIAGGVAGAISMAGESTSLVYLRFWCEVLSISADL
jgi:VIT1/CCC1 family predicted Fe2+/Mn2+ transporter